MKNVLGIFVMLYSAVSFGQFHKDDVQEIKFSEAGSAKLDLKAAIFDVIEECRQGSWLPSCDERICHTETKEECVTKTIRVCENTFDCKDISVRECGPVSHEVCERPNMCSEPAGYEEICEDTQGPNKLFSSRMELDFNFQEIGELKDEVKVKVKLHEKTLSLSAGSSSYLVLKHELGSETLVDTASTFHSAKSFKLTPVALEDLKPKVNFSSVNKLQVVLSRHFFNEESLNELPLTFSIKITNRDRNKTYLEQEIKAEEIVTLSNGDKKIEFWRFGFKKKLFTSYIVKIEAKLNPKDVLPYLKKKYGSKVEVLNPKSLSNSPLNSYFEGRF